MAHKTPRETVRPDCGGLAGETLGIPQGDATISHAAPTAPPRPHTRTLWPRPPRARDPARRASS
eukprot:4883595-Alexandrium_andersonii.AAC.1